MLHALVAASLLTLGQTTDKTVIIPGRPPIGNALFNPDGRRLYFASRVGVEAHDIETGKQLFTAPFGGELVCSPKGDLLGIVRIEIGMISIGGSVAVLNAATGKLLHQERGTSATFSPDSRWLISHAGHDRSNPTRDQPPKVQVTDLRTGKMHIAELALPKANGFSQRAEVGIPFNFSKDGKTLVTLTRSPSGQYDVQSACDLETGKKRATLPKLDDIQLPRLPRYSADGTRYADGFAVHEVATGKMLAKLEGPPKHNTWSPALHLSLDGKLVYGVTAVRRERTIDEKNGRTTLTMSSQLNVWDADTGKWKQAIADAPRAEILSGVLFKKRGGFGRKEAQFVVNMQCTHAVDYDEDAAHVWDLATGKIVRTFRDVGLKAQPDTIRFSFDSKQIAVSASTSAVTLWNVETGALMRTLESVGYVASICFRPKSNELVGVGYGAIFVWDVKTGVLKRGFEQKSNFFGIECSPDGKLAAISDHWSDSVMLLDLDTGKAVHYLTGKSRSLAFHPDGSLLTLDIHGGIAQWNVATGKSFVNRPGNSANYRYTGRRIAFVPGTPDYFLCENDSIAIAELATGKRIYEHAMKSAVPNHPTDADIHSDGKRCVIAHAGNRSIEERDIATGKVLATYPGHLHGTSKARYSPDGARLATIGVYTYEVRIHPVPRQG